MRRATFLYVQPRWATSSTTKSNSPGHLGIEIPTCPTKENFLLGNSGGSCDRDLQLVISGIRIWLRQSHSIPNSKNLLVEVIAKNSKDLEPIEKISKEDQVNEIVATVKDIYSSPI